MLNISFKYIKIIEITLNHEYFSDGYSPYIKIEPSLPTKLFMDRYNLTSKNLGKGIGIFADKYNSIPFREYMSAEEICLTFYIKIKDKNFFRYTNLPQRKTDEILYFCNNKDNLSKKDTISTDDYISVNEFIKNSLKNNASKPQTDDLGVLEIKLNKKNQKEVIKILDSDDKDKPIKYTLTFTSPNSMWRYILVPAKNEENYNFEIKSLKHKITFKEEKTDKQDKHYVFLSKEQMPVLEKNSIKLELWSFKDAKDRTKGKLVNPYLPIPNKVSFFSSDLKSYISEVYINI